MGPALRRAAPPTISHRLSLESTIHPLCRILRRPCVLFSGLFESRQPSSVFFLQSIYQPLPACASACASASTMSTAMRLGSSALRTSLRAPAFSAGTTSFQAIRCYSAKTQVCVAAIGSYQEALDRHVSPVKSSPASGGHAWPTSLTHRLPARPSRSASPSSCPRRSRRSRPSESQSPQTRLFDPISCSNKRANGC